MIAALIVAGITVLPISAPTPRCDRAPRALLTVTTATEAEALEALAAKVREAGGDTLKLTKTQRSEAHKLTRISGYGFLCRDDAARGGQQ